MDLLTRIEASLEFMNDGGPIRVDFTNLREVLEGSREALLKLAAVDSAVRDWRTGVCSATEALARIA